MKYTPNHSFAWTRSVLPSRLFNHRQADILTPKQVSEQYGICMSTVYASFHAPGFPHIHGQKLRVRRAALEGWIYAQRYRR